MTLYFLKMEFTYEILKEAWKNTVTQNSEEANRARFKYYLEDNLYSILYSIKDNTFAPKPLRYKTIYVPKKRFVQVPTLADKIIQHAICDNYLYNVVASSVVPQTSACLIGRGDSYASAFTFRNLVKYKEKYGTDFYVLKCDIHHYFASIPHDQLLELVDQYVKDEDVSRIMKLYISMTDAGIPLGLQQSQLMANLYLDRLDRYILEDRHEDFYFRHMDDFYILSNSHDHLRQLHESIDAKVIELGLTLNPKTAIFHNKFTFLGFEYRFDMNGKPLKRLDKSKRNTKRRHLKKLLRDLRNGDITADKFADSYAGWRVHALNGDCTMLVETWDRWLCCELKKLGYDLIIKDRSVKIKCLQEEPLATSR